MANQTKQIMSRNLITISADAPLQEAYQLMQKRRIRHLPAVDEQKAIIGILSDRDLQRAMEPHQGASPQAALSLEFNSKFKVRDFMSTPVKCIAEDTAVRDVALRMLEEKLSMFLVVDPEMHPHGIVTTDDMLKLLISFLDKDPSRSEQEVGRWVRENAMNLSYLD